MDNKEYVVLLENPLLRVDMSRMTVGDFVRITTVNNYGYALLAKCALDNLDEIPFEYAPAVMQAWANELTQYLKDITTVQELFKGN